MGKAWRELIQALYLGHELSNVALWKNTNAAIGAISAFLSAIVGIAVVLEWIPKDLVTQEIIMTVSSALVSVVMTINAYFAWATSKRVGIKPKEEDEPPFGI